MKGIINVCVLVTYNLVVMYPSTISFIYQMIFILYRMMGAYKRAVTQKARVEGSICSDYLSREISYFCSHYFKTFNLVPTSGLRNDPGGSVPSCSLSIFTKRGRPSGSARDHYLSPQEYQSAHVHVLINCGEVKPYLE